MEIKVLNEDNVKRIYEKEMVRDFPAAEIKPLKTILQLMEQGCYRCYGAFDQDVLLAYVFFVWNDKQFALLDYFAVLPKYRRMGIGGNALALCKNALAAEKFLGILLEIERISLAQNEEQKRQRTDRKRFYLQNGYQESGLRTEIFGTGYQILYICFDKREISDEQIKKAYEEIYRKMVKTSSFERHVVVGRRKS